MAETVEQSAIQMADKTGTSDVFALQNVEEITLPLDDNIVSDPDSISIDPVKVTKEQMQAIEKAEMEKFGFFESGEQRDIGLYEKMFGYNYAEDIPYKYDQMNWMQRAAVRAELRGRNMTTRVGLGATHQIKGLIQLVTPKSVEEYLTTDKEAREGRLEEDQYYERRIQKALKEKVASGTATEDETEQLAYLDETLPSGIQRSPEFVGRVAAEIEQIALAHEVFSAIPMPGGGTLSGALSDLGKKVLGGKLATAGAKAGNKYVSAGLNTLATQMERLGPNVGELFTWGVISRETEEDESALKQRLASGSKMTAWAAVPVLLAPTGKVISKTPAGQYTGQLLKKVFAKATAPVADTFSSMKTAQAKKAFVNRALTEADDLHFQETGVYLTSETKKVVREQIVSIADDTAKIANQSADDITAKVEELAGETLSKRAVGPERVIPETLRVAESAGDDVINSAASIVEARTGYITFRQPNGNYSILDKTNLHEVAVNIKRKNIAKEIDNLVFGVGNKAPVRNPLDKTKLRRTKRTVVEEVELKRAIRRMNAAANDAHRAGMKEATEKAAIKLKHAQERINTIRMSEKGKWENVEFARQIVKDFVPKQEQHAFLNRITRARTEGGVEKIMEDVTRHIDRSRVNTAVDGIRASLKQARSKYSTKAGSYAAAPDEIRPILESLDKASRTISKRGQIATEAVDDLNALADDMVAGINNALSGRGEVVGIPETLANDLYSLSGERGQMLVSDVEALANLAKIIIHRSDQAGTIRINGVLSAASEAVDDSILNIVPKRRPVKDVQDATSLVKRLFTTESDHPSTLVTKMFGPQSKAGVLLDDLYQGEVEAMGVMRNSYGIIKEYMAQENISDDIYKTLEKKVSITIGGKSYKVTRNDVLGLAMSTRDPWVFDNMAKTRGITIGGFDTRARMSYDEIADAISKLSDDEMKFGGAMFHLNNNYLSNIINGTSLELNGVKLATYPQYYPSHRVMSIKTYGNKFSVKTAETQSQFMPRVGGTSPMKINPYTTELMSYIQNSSMYKGTAIPMRSMKTVMSNATLQDDLVRGGYKDELSAFLESIARSEGMYSDQSVVDTIGSKAINRFTKAVLGGRVSTIGTQVGSVPAAKSVIPGKYFNVADHAKSKATAEELAKTSDMFWHRWTGRRVSVEMGDLSSTSSIDHFLRGKIPLTEKPLSGLVLGDKQAIGKIHIASRRMIADTTKLAGSEAELAAIRLTEKATRLTQPNWSPLTRSKLGTDPSTFKRMFTMFRTAQEAQLNVLKRANANFQRAGAVGERTASDWKNLGDSYKSVAESIVNVATWKALWKHGRKAGIASIGAWLGYSVIDKEEDLGKDIAENIADTTVGLFPLGKEIESLVEIGIDSAIGDKAFVNTSRDPISTITNATARAINTTFSLVNSYIEMNRKRTGVTSDFLDVSLDDMLSEIGNTEAEKEELKLKFKKDVTNAVIESAKATGLLVGLPVAPIDEFVTPALKRSEFAQVNKVDAVNSSNPAKLARDMHRFLTEMKKLTNKEEEKGLTQKEAQRLFDMKIFKETNIDIYIGIQDVLEGDSRNGSLDDLENNIERFMKN
jgi:hypothetical protein